MKKTVKVSRNEIEKMILENIKLANLKLEKEFSGTREAIRQIAAEKAREFIAYNDLGLKREERTFLEIMITASMFQSFCYGYSIGKVEGKTSKNINI